MKPVGLQFSLTDQADGKTRDLIHQQIRAFNDQASEYHRAVRPTGPSPLDVLIRDDCGQLVGGLVAATYWGWLDIEDLWIDVRLRGQGHGRHLMRMAESEAVSRGCANAMVSTFSFQARGFYEKLGYRVVGVLDGYPPGQAFFWLCKDLLAVGQGQEAGKAE